MAAWLRASRDALTNAEPRSFDYGNGQGEPTLRQALATYLGRARGVSADPARVVVTAGVTQALWLISRVVAARGGRTLAMEDPCHEPHRDAVRDAGLEVVPLPVDRYGARVGDLADRGRTRCSRPRPTSTRWASPSRPSAGRRWWRGRAAADAW